MYSQAKMIEEEEKLLPEIESRGILRRSKPSPSQKLFCILLVVYIIGVHVALTASLLSNSSISIKSPGWYKKTRLQKLRSQLGKSTSNEHATNFTEYTEYSGPPNEDNHDAWKKILQNLYLNATEEEMLTEGGDPEKSIQVKGGGYLAALGVHHELHCLNKIRFFLYSHRTQKTWEESDMAYWYRHLDHCVEVLRLSVMCTSDLSLYTFTWPKNNNSEFLELHSSSERQCGNWKQVEDWSENKRTSMQKGLLVPEDTFHNTL